MAVKEQEIYQKPQIAPASATETNPGVKNNLRKASTLDYQDSHQDTTLYEVAKAAHQSMCSHHPHNLLCTPAPSTFPSTNSQCPQAAQPSRYIHTSDAQTAPIHTYLLSARRADSLCPHFQAQTATGHASEPQTATL